jgi:hypothetical protein
MTRKNGNKVVSQAHRTELCFVIPSAAWESGFVFWVQ